MQHPEYSNGEYTIDPNMGSTKDSLKSFCEFKSSTIRTCVRVSQIMDVHVFACVPSCVHVHL